VRYAHGSSRPLELGTLAPSLLFIISLLSNASLEHAGQNEREERKRADTVLMGQYDETTWLSASRFTSKKKCFALFRNIKLEALPVLVLRSIYYS